MFTTGGPTEYSCRSRNVMRPSVQDKDKDKARTKRKACPSEMSMAAILQGESSSAESMDAESGASACDAYAPTRGRRSPEAHAPALCPW